ncbi:MAG TPA: HNH endonuclease [Allosphingosinicella sp.]
MAAPLEISTMRDEPPRHWVHQLPYRAIVFIRSNASTPLYAVAGLAGGPWNAENALKAARDAYPATCFYCGTSKKASPLTIDHIEPLAGLGTGDLANMVLACKPCNVKKDQRPIEVFRPDAGREWLSRVLRQVQERLNRLP